MSELTTDTTIESVSAVVVSVATPTFGRTVAYMRRRIHLVAHASQVNIPTGPLLVNQSQVTKRLMPSNDR